MSTSQYILQAEPNRPRALPARPTGPGLPPPAILNRARPIPQARNLPPPPTGIPPAIPINIPPPITAKPIIINISTKTTQPVAVPPKPPQIPLEPEFAEIIYGQQKPPGPPNQITQITIQFKPPYYMAGDLDLPESKYLYPNLLETLSCSTIAQIPGNSDYIIKKIPEFSPPNLDQINNYLASNKPKNPPGQNLPYDNIIIPLSDPTKIKGLLYSVQPNYPNNPQPYGQLDTINLKKIRRLYQNAISDIKKYNSNNNTKFTCFEIFLLNSCPFASQIPKNNKNIRNPLHAIFSKDIALATLMGIFMEINSDNFYLDQITIPGVYAPEFVIALHELCVEHPTYGGQNININLSDLAKSKIHYGYNLFTKYYYPETYLLINNSEGELLISDQGEPPNSRAVASNLNILQISLAKIYNILGEPFFDIIRIYNQYDFKPIIFNNQAIYQFPLPKILYNSNPVKIKSNYKFQKITREYYPKNINTDQINQENIQKAILIPDNPTSCEPGFKIEPIPTISEYISEISVEFVIPTNPDTLIQYQGNPEYNLDPEFISKFNPDQINQIRTKISELKFNNKSNILVNIPGLNLLYSVFALHEPAKPTGYLLGVTQGHIRTIYEDAINQILAHNNSLNPNKITCFRICLLETGDKSMILPTTNNPLYQIYCKDISLSTIIGIFKKIFESNKYLKIIQVDSKFSYNFKMAIYELCIPLRGKTIIIKSGDLTRINHKFYQNPKYYFPDCYLLITKNNKILINTRTNNIPKAQIKPNNINILTDIITNQIFEPLIPIYLDLNLIYEQFNFYPIIINNNQAALFWIPEPPNIYLKNQKIGINKNLAWAPEQNYPDIIQFKNNKPQQEQINLEKQKTILPKLITCNPDIKIL